MFRMRRYRVFLIFAVIALGALYHFKNLGGLESAGAASVEGWKNFGHKITTPKDGSKSGANDRFNEPVAIPSLVDSGTAKPSDPAAKQAKGKGSESSKKAKANNSDPQKVPTPINGGIRAGTKAQSEAAVSKAAKPDYESIKAQETSANQITTGNGSVTDSKVAPDVAKGKYVMPVDSSVPKIHWTPLPEHFPVPTESLIQLPTDKPKAIPKVQHDFSKKEEGTSEKAERQEKLDLIKKTFSFSWQGYRKEAWMADELRPVSGKTHNPFGGWGATLVDTLDTLWMMGMEEDFMEALDAVREIDFTTCGKNDIPLFETVIRYLGGLIAAYDISGGVHRILLDKAVELAEVLMGAFDTPNRMPMTFYLWKPTFATQPHRAKTRVVLAELGSLSVEFTRLAQITKETKYYDAIARITNEFEIWQSNTKLPGLWPLKVDASGCKKPDRTSANAFGAAGQDSKEKPLALPGKTADEKAEAAAYSNILDGGPALKDSVSKGSDAKTDMSGSSNAQTYKNEVSATPPQGGAILKRDVSNESALKNDSDTSPKPPDCEPQGLASPPHSAIEEFTMGGQADSTYEYLPKEYMLLGGLEEKYQTMYEMAIEATKEKLLFRPMIPDEKRHILQAGLIKATGKEKPIENIDNPNFKPEGTHLTCFVGGMFAVGAKIFNREADMDLARKLTDGCVWAYEATTTGIMPESYLSVQCPDPDHCPWNETLWHEKLDLYGETREKNRLAQLKQEAQAAEEKTVAAKSKAASEDAIGVETPERPYQDSSAQNRTIPAASKDEEEKVIIADTAKASNRAETGKSQAAPGTDSDDTISSKDAKADTKQSDSLPKTATKGDDSVIPPREPLKKRQLGEIHDESPATPAESAKDTFTTTSKGKSAPETSGSQQKVEKSSASTNGTAVKDNKAEIHASDSEAKTSQSPSKTSGSNEATEYKQPSIPTHEEFVHQRIKSERLPTGMTKITGGRYLLRPEAIESVFIMYRATGEDYWREKGWKMFKAIEKHTGATYGASAISDVTLTKPKLLDEMESFWLAETLKYFYLLFSEPSVVSLDDYVLNTEAHPFKRPK